ncbi:hypothetical protein C2G38_2061530 [Gigaspora rosea]|uniref:Uncharacterized protein n=1 Tax=Gigaspora rosea TaxID=44941 RepID=A0A397VYG5_9GLOM|nr:hypothetical protein C2G38_2061530 [Gigaspora rosea]
MKFIPFPPRPKSKQIDGTTNNASTNPPERYPPKDGYENNRQLNVIARAILISDDLVKLWKRIGYYEICEDVNDLVMQGALLILFPPNPSAKWVQPDTYSVSERLQNLIDLGFQLNYVVICDIFMLFERRLKNIGEILLEAFIMIKKSSRTRFLEECLIEILKTSRNLNDPDLWEFLYSHLRNPEISFNKVFDYYMDTEKSNKSNELNTSTISLNFSSKFYYWILLKFGSDSSISTRCFEEIFDTFVNLDKQIQQNPENETYQLLFKSTCDIFFVYCNVKNFFCPLNIDKLSQCKNSDILSIVFEHYLPLLFGIEVTQILLPLPSTEEFYIQYTSNSNTKRKYPKQELEEWLAKLENIYFSAYYGSNNVTEEFKQSLFTFCDTKLPNSKFFQNQKNKTNKKKCKTNYDMNK